MPNLGNKLVAAAAASIWLASSLAATSAAAQSNEPVFCTLTADGYYFCCSRYDVCTYRYIGDAPLSPEEPSEPSEPSEPPQK